jgi:hypothetical protein
MTPARSLSVIAAGRAPKSAATRPASAITAAALAKRRSDDRGVLTRRLQGRLRGA